MREIGIVSCPQGCAGQSESKRNRTPAAELDFGSEANHAVSNYQTVFAAIPTVNQNQPLIMHSFVKLLKEVVVFFLARIRGKPQQTLFGQRR